MPLDYITPIELPENFTQLPGVLQNRLNNFILEINEDIAYLNHRIHDYNQDETQPEAIKLLYRIYIVRNKIDSRYGNDVKSNVPNYYNQLHDRLFTQIKEAFSTYGIESISQTNILSAFEGRPPPESTVFSEFLANLEPEKVNYLYQFLLISMKQYPVEKYLAENGVHLPEAFADYTFTYREIHGHRERFILSSKTTDENIVILINNRFENEGILPPALEVPDPAYFFETLYLYSRAMSTKQRDLLETLGPKFANFSLTFLGGKNSKNFLVHPVLGEPQVLRIYKRFRNTAEASMHLGNRVLIDDLATNYAERVASFESNHETQLINIAASEFIVNGNLISYSSGLTTKARLNTALNFYSQMALILMKIEDENCAFPDLKNSNWLVAADAKIKIGDDKSLIIAQNKTIGLKQGNVIIFSPFTCPPEVKNKEGQINFKNAVNVSRIHAYGLGINLYQYLTQKPNSYFTASLEGSAFDFSDEIFLDETGQELRNLILELLEPAEEYRLSIKEACIKLQNLKADNIIQEIKKFAYSSHDAPLGDYIANIRIAMFEAIASENLQALFDINADLEKTLDVFLDSDKLQAIRRNFQTLENNASKFLAFNSKKRIQSLRHEMNSIPFRERLKILSGNTRGVDEDSLMAFSVVETALGLGATTRNQPVSSSRRNMRGL